MGERRTYGDPCGVARSLDVVGERWALLIVRELLLGPKRFNDLLDGLVGASPNVVSQRLRQLADHGVVLRRGLGPPAHVHVYELTEWGRELEPLILRLGLWGARAPLPPGGELGLDSVMLGIKAAFDPTGAKGEPATYEIHVGRETFAITLSDGSLHIGRERIERPDATLTTDCATLRAVCEGRRTASEALRTGDLRVDGERSAVRAMTDLLFGSSSRPRQKVR